MKRLWILAAASRGRSRALGAPRSGPSPWSIVGGTVVTENAQHQVLSPGAVAIDGTDIVAVGTPEEIAAQLPCGRDDRRRATKSSCRG